MSCRMSCETGLRQLLCCPSSPQAAFGFNGQHRIPSQQHPLSRDIVATSNPSPTSRSPHWIKRVCWPSATAGYPTVPPFPPFSHSASGESRPSDWLAEREHRLCASGLDRVFFSLSRTLNFLASCSLSRPRAPASACGHWIPPVSGRPGCVKTVDVSSFRFVDQLSLHAAAAGFFPPYFLLQTAGGV